MKTPKTTLPWDENLEFICNGDRQDLEYIQEACNNFPKAVELLKELVQYLDWREDYIVEEAFEGEENQYSKSKEFLKSRE